MEESEIFISYSWADDNLAIIEAIDRYFRKQGIKILRDKREILYKGLIKEYMQRLGRGKYVIIVLSDDYLKSKYCMFELIQLAKNPDLYDRIFPIVTEGTKIYDAEDILNYVIYWENKFKSLDKEIRKSQDISNLQGIYEDLNLYAEIRQEISSLLNFLRNINTLSIKDLDFTFLFEAIRKKISLDKRDISNQISSTSYSKKEKRLLHKIEELEERWRLVSGKISMMQEQYDLETRIEERLRVEVIINKAENDRDAIETQIEEIEKELSNDVSHEKIPPREEVSLKPVYPFETILKLQAVFKESGTPKITFVEPAGFQRLKFALEEDGRGVVVEGPSGIGKTTAVEEAIHQLRKLDEYEKEFIILRARVPEDVKKLDNIEQWQQGIVVIDDFHRLNKTVRDNLADRLKYLADISSSKKLVIVGIPYTRTRLVEVGYDIATRIEVISMGKASDILIDDMIKKGELALNISFSEKEKIIKLANGSLNIAQMLAKNIAFYDGVRRTQHDYKIIKRNLDSSIDKIKDTLRLKYDGFIRTFIQLGGVKDHTCLFLLKTALTEDGEGHVSLTNIQDTEPRFKTGIKKFISNNYIAKLQLKYPEYEQFLYYDKHGLTLTADDPQLMFYLKQISSTQLRKETGIR